MLTSDTVLIVLSLYLWRIAYEFSDWAILALLPLALVIFFGSWPLHLEPWRAQMGVAVRDDSPLSRILTGKIRTLVLSSTFAVGAVLVLAWQALSATAIDAVTLIAALLVASVAFSTAQGHLVRHFHAPFARSIATVVVTWAVALPFTVAIAVSTWAWRPIPGGMFDADLSGAVHIYLSKLPEHRGLISELLAVPFAFEAAKLWVVIQLRDYPFVAAIFSLDAAIVSFVVCRAGIVVTQFAERHALGANA